jgi:hypothetical protein
VTLDAGLTDSVYKGRLSLVQQDLYNRSFRPNSSKSGLYNKITLGQGVKTFYPKSYYDRCGYQKSETAASTVVKRDSLGQRVRERFNEDLGQSTSVKSSARNQRKLKSFLLQQEEAKSVS